MSPNYNKIKGKGTKLSSTLSAKDEKKEPQQAQI